MATEKLDINDIYENKAWYEITFQNEDGETEIDMINVTHQDYWGNINTVDGTCFWEWKNSVDHNEKMRMFDGIGYGNDVDGYKKIVKVVNSNTGRAVPLKNWAKFIDSLVELFSDM